ncbi:hypothetical protein HDE78_002533 [Rhodanobacter sp. K2T2]|uniref:hypothetical protein n=1 Tax=Rhodanobacter sp. K2T2 TaxID=2723085 RepID=UPI0015CE880D|nr:hypothetical protein [Rhodanobacter sp. K2T2]NYE29567.1 hypothetical protein [Rhodanobacter sp. K2T2]
MTETHGDALAMAQQVQSLLHDLAKLGLAEARAEPTATANTVTAHPSSATTFEVLRSLAEHVGYRIA